MPLKIHFGFKGIGKKKLMKKFKEITDPKDLWEINLRERSTKSKERSNKDQLPDFLLISNTGRINLNHIIYDAKPKSVNGVQIEGIFGETGDVDGKEVKNKDDYAQFAYMLNHLIHAGKKIPFVMFLAFDNESSIIDILRRKERFIEQLKASKRLYLEDENAVEVVYHEHGEKELVVVLYNKQNNRFYVLNEESMTKISISEWAQKTETPDEWLKEKIVNKMEKTDDKLKIIVELAKLNTAIRCCDARSHNLGEVERVVKTLGAILTMDEMIRIMKKNPKGIVHSEFHTTCGYITSATKMYIMLKKLVKLGEDYRNAVMDEIRKAVSNPDYRMNLDEAFAKNVDPKLFEALFASPNKDFQNILIHMLNVGVLEILLDQNRILMKSYERITDELKKRNMAVSFGVLVYLITEEIIRNQASMVRVAARRVEKAIPLDMEWYFSILSFVDYKRYIVPSSIDKSIESLERKNELGEIKRIEEII